MSKKSKCERTANLKLLVTSELLCFYLITFISTVVKHEHCVRL